jgi:L-asparaginase II
VRIAVDNPVIVEILRSGRVESRHRGALAVCDDQGKTLLALGDVARPVYPRSAVKALQALPLLESGIADRLELTAAEIALACASHSGEPIHCSTAMAMLHKCGHEPGDLECGIHWPLGEAAQRALAALGGQPTTLHNNCSGKHAGFLCLATGMGVPARHYVRADHPVQREITACLESMTEQRLDANRCGIDGCSIPTFAIPLTALAYGFAKLASGRGLSPSRAGAAERLRASVARHPDLVAGSGRFDTAVMSTLGVRAFTKTGAEGVFCAALPEQGLGIALKCDDGATRAAEVTMAQAIARFLPLSAAEAQALAPRLSPRLFNWNGIEVGRMRFAAALEA